jgi:hypothetical protein
MNENSELDRYISLADAQVRPASNVDTHGRLFFWKDQVLRGIYPEWAEFYGSLLKSPIFCSLVSAGLVIETEPTDLSMDGYPLIVRHRRLDVVSYSFEWCFDALKDAALLTLTLQERLLPSGLTLQDSHPWNILFDGCRPVHVDLGSIMPNGQGTHWNAIEEFRRYALNPLIVMAAGHARIMRALYFHHVGISDSEITIPLRSRRDVASALWGVAKRIRCLRDVPVSRLLAQLRKEVDGLSLPKSKQKGPLYSERASACNPLGYANVTLEAALHVLSVLKPRSVLATGLTGEQFSRLAADRFGCTVISVDVDETSMNELFVEGKRGRLPIFPLVMDLTNPSSGSGVLGRTFPPAIERFKSEMVVALATVRQLAFEKKLGFEQIVETLAAFSGKWLLVEFLPREDKFVSESWSESYAWYTLAGWKAALSKHFSKIEIIETAPASGVLLLCEI